MARGKRAPAPRSMWPYVWLAAGVLAVAVALAVVFGGSREEGVAGGMFEHLHGMGVDATDPEALVVATHTGLHGWDGRWSALGRARDDYMGFSAHPRDGGVFLVSGHPAGGGNMGLRRSADGGATWQQVGAEGMDFHAMAVSPADPSRLWGAYAGQLWRSDDAGASWTSIAGAGQAPRAYALAGGADARDTLYATTATGLLRGDDGGRSWETLAPRADVAVGTTPADPRALWTAGPAGVHRSDDGGANWTRVPLDLPGQDLAYIAVAPSDADVVYVASHQTGVWRTRDGGQTWTILHAPRV